MSDVCCDIDVAVKAVAGDCDLEILSGLKDLRITTLCQLSSVVVDAEPDVVVSDITMATISSVVQKFYKVETHEGSLMHEFDNTANEESGNKNFKNTIAGEVKLKSAAVFNALNKYLGKELVVLGKENGTDGKWRIIGLGGGLKVTQVQGSTGLKKSENSNTKITITGDTGKRWLYVWDTDASTTDALVNGITAS